MIDEKTIEGTLQRSTERLRKDTSPNQLLSELIRVTEVHGFMEKIPAINEIFISLVKETSHE